MKNKSNGSSWIKYVFLSVLYFFLPRVQLTMDSHLWTLIPIYKDQRIYHHCMLTSEYLSNEEKAKVETATTKTSIYSNLSPIWYHQLFPSSLD